MKFKIGDYVRIKKGVTRYSYSAPGSTGHIINFLHVDMVEINFDKFTGRFHDTPASFIIRISNIELVKQKKPKI